MSQNSQTPSHSYNFFCNCQPQFIIHYYNKYKKHTLSNALLKYFITIKLITYLTVLTFLRETQLLIDPFFLRIFLSSFIKQIGPRRRPTVRSPVGVTAH